MSRIVQVQSGQSQISLNKGLFGSLEKTLLSNYDYGRKVVNGAFTSTLTDLGPGILFSSPITLSGLTEDAKTVASFTPGYSGYIGATFALVTTAVTTASRSANLQVFIDQDAGVSEVDTLTTTGTPTGGNLTITVNGVTSGNIAFNAAAATVQTALEAMSNIAVGDVVCSGGALPTGVVLTWGGSFAGQPVTVTASGAGLTGGTTPTAVITNNTAATSTVAPTAISGGVIALTSANATPVAKVVPGSQVVTTNYGDATTSPNTFGPTSIISVRSSGVPVAFAEGAVIIGIEVHPFFKSGPLAA